MKRFRKFHLLLALAVLCGCRAPALAQEPSAADWLDRAAVVQAARAVTRDNYPNADDVLVDDLIRARYQADGTAICTDDTFTKVLTEKGRREGETLSFHFTIPYDRIEVLLVEVVKPDGAVVPVDVKAQSRVMTDRSQMASNIYNPNRKILRLGVPGLKVGDLLHYRFVRRTVKARIPNTWSEYEVFEYTSPVRRLVYEVIGPKALPLRRITLRDKVKGTVAHSRTEKDGRLHYRWVVSNVPRMYREPDMPPLHTVVQRLLVSTIADWKDISQWYSQLCKPHLEAGDDMKRTVAELTQGLEDRQKRIEAIFRFVSQKVRYMGLTTEKEAPGYEPHDARITFKNRYGVCRDKAALLVALLREAGIEAYPTLIHNGPRKDAEVPQPYFNHAIVAVQDPDGAYQLMDATDENTRELFPSYLANQSYLVAKPDGDTLRTSPIVPAEKNLVRIETSGKLGSNGALRAESVLRFEGVNDGAYRGYFARIKPAERRRFFEGLAKRVVSGAKLVAFDIQPANLRDVTHPLAVRMELEAAGILISDGGTVMLPTPSFGTRIGLVNFLLGKTGLKERRYPLVTGFACGVAETLSIEVDEALGEALSMPTFDTVDNDTLRFSQALGRKDSVLQGRSSFLLKGVEFTPPQYLALKDALKTQEYNRRKMPVFAAPAAAASPDVVVLDVKARYDLTDAHNWSETRTVRMKILTYAGKKQNAELKFNYNPAWETVKLEHATVTAADGEKKPVTPEEQNVMDAAWVGAAPRYPAGKTLVVSLPGVEVGCVIEYRVRRTKKDRPFFGARESFRGFDPIRSKEVVLETPHGLSLVKQMLMPKEVEHSVAQPGAPRQRECWTVRDAGAVTRERYLPPWWSFNPTVCLSTGDWSSYAQSVRKALLKAASDQDETRQKSLDLTGDLAGKEDKIHAVRDFVACAVRLAGPALHAVPLSAITAADRTLKEGYGNTADRAVVLYAMLEAAALEPEFILASSTPVVNGLEPPLLTCPRPADFGTVLVRVAMGKDFVYLNDTDQYAALGATPHDNYYGLTLSEGKVETIRAVDDKEDQEQTDLNIAVSENGEARITRTTRYYGNAFGRFHKKFAEMPPEERRRYHQEAVAQIAQAAEADGDLVTRYDAYPGEERITVKVKGFAVREGDYLYFQLPETLADLFGFQADTRWNPLYRSHARRIVIRTRVRTPAGFDTFVLRPREMQEELPNGAGTIRLKETLSTPVAGAEPQAGLALTIEHRAELKPSVLPASSYDELLKLQRRLGHPKARTLLLRQKVRK